MSKNTNCLEGIKCPKCGNEDKFVISVVAHATVTDDGFRKMQGTEGLSLAIWCRCGADGTVKTFITKEN